MSTVLLLILLIVSIIMTGLILIQRSEGGALGIGGGGGGGGLMSGRSAANSVTSMTGILGGVFLVCCLLLSIVFNRENQATSILDEANAEAPLTTPAESEEYTDPLAGLGQAATDTSEQVSDSTTPPAEDTPEDPDKPERE